MEFSGGEGAVQPEGSNGAEEGQGAQSQEMDPGLYPGIENVPSELRQHVDPILREMNNNANKRISEVNTKLEAWKPYEELGIRDNIDPETMKGLMGLVEMFGSAEDDPTELRSWWENLGNQFGFTGESNENEEPDEFEEEFEEGQNSPEDIKQIVREAVAEEMNPLREQQENQERENLMQSVNQRIDNEFQQIKDKFGQFAEDDEKAEEIEARIVRLAMQYANDNNGEGSILKGFEDYQAILKDGEGSLFQEVSNQPNKPEGPGTPDTTKEKPRDMKEAEKLAENRLAQLRQ